MKRSPGNAPALVVLVNNQADWQRIVEQGWYRIPLRRAPTPVAAAYLAFYQSRVFGDDAFTVRYYAAVRRYELVTRREIIPAEPDHPRADERYYRIVLGPIQALARPIPSRRLRRITFIPTTMRRLQEADEINDLWIGDDVEMILWELFGHAVVKAERRLTIGEQHQRYGNTTPALHGSAGATGFETRRFGVLSPRIEAGHVRARAVPGSQRSPALRGPE